jgi:plasmid stabilization system protein ParE
MRKIVFSPESIEDLQNIWLYIAQDSPSRADHFLDKLQTLCRGNLTLSPEIGRGRDYLDEGVLAFPFGLLSL